MEVIEAAKPIDEIRTEQGDGYTEKKEPEILSRSDVDRDDLRSLTVLLETMRENGLLDLLEGLVRNYEHAIKLITDELSRDSNQRFLTNALTIYTLLSSIDPERLTNFVRNLASSFNNADESREKGSVGILSLLSEMKDRDVSAGIRVLLNIMKGFTTDKKESE